MGRKAIGAGISWAAKKITSDDRTQKIGSDLATLYKQYKVNQNRIRLIDQALKSQSKGALAKPGIKKMLRSGYASKPGMEGFEGLTKIRQSQASVIRAIRKLGGKRPK